MLHSGRRMTPPPSTAVLHKFVGAWPCWSSPTSFHSWSTPPSLLCTLLVQGGWRPALHPVLLLLPWPPLFSLQCPHGLRMFVYALLCCFCQLFGDIFATCSAPCSTGIFRSLSHALLSMVLPATLRGKSGVALAACKCLPLLFMHSHLVDSESALWLAHFPTVRKSAYEVLHLLSFVLPLCL